MNTPILTDPAAFAQQIAGLLTYAPAVLDAEGARLVIAAMASRMDKAGAVVGVLDDACDALNGPFGVL